jgi:hypothetical protein
MDEPTLRQFLSRLGIRAERTNRRGWIPFPCPLAQWTHERGRDSRSSAAARVNTEGPSTFVCKACHQHGRFSKLINLLATYRQDDSLRPLILAADRAEAESVLAAGFDAFERPVVIDEIEPLVEAQFDGLYQRAWDVPDAREYLDRRGITETASDIIGLVFEPGQRRILFPVRDHPGRLYGYTGRAIDADITLKIRDYYGLPKRHLVLGEHLWQHGKPLVIVEGLFGFASLIARGVLEIANIGALLGSALTPEKAARIIDFDEPTYLLLDNDQGGDIGLFGTLKPDGTREDNGAVARLTGHVPIYLPEWPDGLADPDQLDFADIQRMLATTPLYAEGSPFDKTWVTWE